MSSGKFPLVKWEDQNRINQFSKLSTRMDRLEDEYKAQKTEKEYLDDLAMEIELLDEDEAVPYKIGDAFVMLTLEAAQERVEKDKTAIDVQVEDLDSQISQVSSEMEELKKMLYAKFGQAINLEKN
ncbi:Prefoldin beta-like protein [Kickxella alabastrina]|uniref:Prefoldin beta-like protein n=1 Tax=Kickxella alabastrina TaxID=61397 RepID=UPI002220C6B7|nr:Prefoldin beta-like protein [Kickxella alabastrina]KAI7835155.1 Prefoldin beta-like protein [Kickxella alabastrina]